MQTYMNLGHIERREKGLHPKPLTFLFLEAFILVLIVFSVSFADINPVTLLAGLVAMYYFMTSCLPRYKAMKERQSSA